MKSNNFLVHLIVAAILSFAISIGAWVFLHVFILGPFIIVSSGAALAAAIAGYFLGKRLWATALLALILRGAILYLTLHQ